MQNSVAVSYRAGYVGVPKIFGDAENTPLGWGVADPIEKRPSPRVTMPNLVVQRQTIRAYVRWFAENKHTVIISKAKWESRKVNLSLSESGMFGLGLGLGLMVASRLFWEVNLRLHRRSSACYPTISNPDLKYCDLLYLFRYYVLYQCILSDLKIYAIVFISGIHCVSWTKPWPRNLWPWSCINLVSIMNLYSA